MKTELLSYRNRIEMERGWKMNGKNNKKQQQQQHQIFMLCDAGGKCKYK